MKKNQKVLGVIPARGGSKGIPKKNIKDLCGKPLISYTILSALQAKLLTRCILSTDSQEIADIGKKYGMDVPFIRPLHLATDEALAVDVMKHALLEMEKFDQCQYDILVMLQPTTALKTAQDIDAAVHKLLDTGCDSVVSVVDVGANHPARMYTIENDKMINVMNEVVPMRPRQQLPPVYIRNGAVYACKREVILKENVLIGKDTRPYIMPVERSVNIDDLSDFVLSEFYLKNQAK